MSVRIRVEPTFTRNPFFSEDPHASSQDVFKAAEAAFYDRPEKKRSNWYDSAVTPAPSSIPTRPVITTSSLSEKSKKESRAPLAHSVLSMNGTASRLLGSRVSVPTIPGSQKKAFEKMQANRMKITSAIQHQTKIASGLLKKLSPTICGELFAAPTLEASLRLEGGFLSREYLAKSLVATVIAAQYRYPWELDDLLGCLQKLADLYQKRNPELYKKTPLTACIQKEIALQNRKELQKNPKATPIDLTPAQILSSNFTQLRRTDVTPISPPSPRIAVVSPVDEEDDLALDDGPLQLPMNLDGALAHLHAAEASLDAAFGDRDAVIARSEESIPSARIDASHLTPVGDDLFFDDNMAQFLASPIPPSSLNAAEVVLDAALAHVDMAIAGALNERHHEKEIAVRATSSPIPLRMASATRTTQKTVVASSGSRRSLHLVRNRSLPSHSITEKQSLETRIKEHLDALSHNTRNRLLGTQAKVKFLAPGFLESSKKKVYELLTTRLMQKDKAILLALASDLESLKKAYSK